VRTGLPAKAGSPRARARRRFWIGLGRGFGGALVFSLPILMSAQMWSLGVEAGRLRLLLFLLLSVPLLVGLSHYSGLRPTAGWLGDAADAMTALLIGFLAAAVILLIFGVITVSMAPRNIVGKVGLEAVPAALGAVLADSQFGESPQKRARKAAVGYAGQLFLMLAGALYLALSVAPTRAMELIAFKMNDLRAEILAVLSIVLLHAFVYRLRFQGQPEPNAATPGWSLFLRFTLVGYAIALLISAYALWTFGRFQGNGLAVTLTEAIALAFPAAVGAAAARLLL